MDRAQRAALASAGIGLVVLGLKFGAWWLTGSLALYSDALESVINVVAACVAFVALRIAAQPADAEHPYGHHKAEYFSAVFEGVLVVVAALVILRDAAGALLQPRAIALPVLGIAASLAATAINAAWGLALLRWSRLWRSPALRADGRHIMADVVTSGGVLVGIGLVAATGWVILDPILAMVVAVNILWSGWVLTRDSVGGLMDQAPPAGILAQVRAVISEHGAGAIEAHDVRSRHAGTATFIEFHLVVPGTMTVEESHTICDRLEAALQADIEGARVTIHVEPGDKSKQRGVPVL